MLGEQGHHAWVLEQTRVYKTEYGKWPNFVSRGNQTYELVSGTNGTYLLYERNGGKGGVLSPPPTNKGAPSQSGGDKSAKVKALNDGSSRGVKSHILRFYVQDAPPVGADPNVVVEYIRGQVNEQLRQHAIDAGALSGLCAVAQSECSNGFVTKEQFRPQHEAMQKGLTDAFQGVLYKHEVGPDVARALSQGKIEPYQEAAKFLADLDSLKKTKGSNRRFPISEDSGFARSEIRRRGFYDGVEAIQALLGERIDANNGHEKMKWFPPRVA